MTLVSHCRHPKSYVYELANPTIAVSPDTAIAIAFGLLSAVISTVGVLIAYLTLRTMSIDPSSRRNIPCPTPPHLQRLISWPDTARSRNLEKGTHLYRHEHVFPDQSLSMRSAAAVSKDGHRGKTTDSKGFQPTSIEEGDLKRRHD